MRSFRIDVSWFLASGAWRLECSPGDGVQWSHCEGSEWVGWTPVGASMVPASLRTLGRLLALVAGSAE